MKTLKVDHDTALQIAAGTKTTTWRINDDKNLSVNDEIEFVDDLVQNRARGQHPDLVFNDGERGVGSDDILGEVAVGELEVARIDDQFRGGFIFLRRRQRDRYAESGTYQGGGDDQQLRPGNAAHHLHRIDQRLPLLVISAIAKGSIRFTRPSGSGRVIRAGAAGRFFRGLP